MALTLILTNHFQAPLTLIPLAGGLGLALIGFSQTPLLLGLLLLLPLFLLVLQVPQCDLQNGLGLTTLGALLTLTIPVACAFNASHYLSWAILGYFFPLAATIWFLLAAASPATGQQHDLILTGTALVLLLAILIRPLSGETILAIMLTMAAWFYLLRFPHHQPQFIYLNLVQLVLIVLIYWT